MVVLTDVRRTLREYFDQVNASCQVSDANLTDELGNQVKYRADYEKQQIPIDQLFIQEANRIVFVISDRGRESIGNCGDIYRVGVQPVILDRWTSTGSMSTRATVLMWKAEQEISRVLRENQIGSVRVIGQVVPATEMANSSLIWGIMVEVSYYQWVSPFGTTTNRLANRRFFNVVKAWKMGVAIGTYSAAYESSGLGPLIVDELLPTEIVIPLGTANIFQLINPYRWIFTLTVRDQNAITQLLKTIDVDNTAAGTQTAILSTGGRTNIDYLAFEVYGTQIVNATDARTSVSTTFSVAKASSQYAVVGSIRRAFDEPGSATVIEFKVSGATETTA